MSLLLALALIASEQSYGPYARPVNGGDVAVAPARAGALLAWSEDGRIRTGMLDAHARLGERIHTLPATTDRAIAIAPAAASNGTSFLIVWLELVPGGERVTAMFAGIDGTPLGTPHHYGPVVPVATSEFLPRLMWDGRAYQLWAARKTFTIGVDGTLLASNDVTQMPHGVAARNGVVGTSALRVNFPHCGFGMCYRTYDVVWTAGPASGAVRVGLSYGLAPALSPSTIAPANHRFAVAWSHPSSVNYLVTGGDTYFVPVLTETNVRPGLACDDTRCLIAYGQSGDVHAFAFPLDRPFSPELSTIAASERVERAPQVHTLGRGRFLVTYRSDGFGGSRLNWRVVTFETPRRRAIGLN